MCIPLSVGYLDRQIQGAHQSASEMLIRRKLDTIKKLVTEYDLSMDVTLVTLTYNLADRLTWMPQRWYNAIKKER